MNDLIGLEIITGGKRRFVGKCGICPPCDIPNLQGHKILYKSELWKNVISHELQCFGIDKYVWEYAAEKLNVAGIACYCKDEHRTILISKEKMDRAFAFQLGAGEGVQLRLPVKDCKIIYNTKEIPIGYTKNTILIEPPTPSSSFTEAIQTPEQIKLF